MTSESNNPTPHTRIRRPGHHLTDTERESVQEVFLEFLATSANIRAACRAAGIDRSTVYYWQEHDEVFSARFKIANAEANDLLLAAAWERGVTGTEKPVVSMGRQVYVSQRTDGKTVKKPLMERVYSDSLLSLLMKARMPEFRDKQHLDIHQTNTNARDVHAMQEAIAKALAPYPEASVAVAQALTEVEKARGQ